MHVTDQEMGYDVILGYDLLSKLGFIINFKDLVMTWDNVSLPMKPLDAEPPEMYVIPDNPLIQDASKRVKEILDAKYVPANLPEVCQAQAHLNPDQQKDLEKLLTKYKDLFNGTLGQWNEPAYEVELQPDAQPYHA